MANYTDKGGNRLIDGGKEEFFARRLSRAGDEADNGSKHTAKEGNRNEIPG